MSGYLAKLSEEITMDRKLSRALRASFLLMGLGGSAAIAQGTASLHPLDGLTTAEYWVASDVLCSAIGRR
jgi:hypothetical protein